MLYLAFPKGSEKPAILDEEIRQKVRLINKRIVPRNKCTGYCDYSLHVGYLDDKLIQNHECVKNECNHLYYLKPKIKNNKRTIEASNFSTISAAEIKSLLEKVDIEGFKVADVENVSWNKYVVEYISLGNIDESEVIDKLKAVIEYPEFELILKQKKVNFDVIEKLFLTI